MRILITGGAGFIGSHLCDRLIAEGHTVLCVDNFLTGARANVVHLLDHPRFQLIEHNITQPLELPGVLEAVLHFASPASPADYLRLPIPTLKVGSIGTWNALGIAKAKHAKFLLASTSEVYGDPQVHPQPEDYWGHVNPVGPRGVYDEAKRFAEAMTMAYHREHGLDTRIARIFNSILADETVLLFNDETLHLESISDYADHLGSRLSMEPPRMLVPAFDPHTGQVNLARARAVIKHPSQSDCFELILRYGRRVKVTGDHSVFTRGPDGKPLAIPVRNLRVGDSIAIPARLPVIERDIPYVHLAKWLLENLPGPELWNYVIQAPEYRTVIDTRREEIVRILAASGKFRARRSRNAFLRATRKYWRQSLLPLFVLRQLGEPIPSNARVRRCSSGMHLWLPATIALTSELLWLIGFFIAAGCAYFRPVRKAAFLSFCSDDSLLDRASGILERLGCPVVRSKPRPSGGPVIFAHSHLLYILFDSIFRVTRQRHLPTWILQLPLARLKFVLEGFREGDGNHSGKNVGPELCFNPGSEKLAVDLTYALLRFGIVASVSRDSTSLRQKSAGRRLPFFRVTVCKLDCFDILSWDRGVRQTLHAKRTGDLIWSRVNRMQRCPATNFVYDFSVPVVENFVAGNGVFCHNTYGPRMRIDDGRAIPNFILQALRQEPITLYGDGSQTRSFCYISDLVEGLLRLLNSAEVLPVNLGNPAEMSLKTLAQTIRRLTASPSPIVSHPLPQDDPRVRCPKLERAQTLLRWAPCVSLEEGLARTVAWFRQAIQAGSKRPAS